MVNGNGWGLWAMSVFGTVRPDDRMQYCATHREHYFHWCGQCAADMQQDEIAAAAPLSDAQRGAVREAYDRLVANGTLLPDSGLSMTPDDFRLRMDAHVEELVKAIEAAGDE